MKTLIENVLESEPVRILKIVGATAAVAGAGAIVSGGEDAVLSGDVWHTAGAAAVVGAAAGIIATLGPWAKRPLA